MHDEVDRRRGSSGEDIFGVGSIDQVVADNFQLLCDLHHTTLL